MCVCCRCRPSVLADVMYPIEKKFARFRGIDCFLYLLSSFSSIIIWEDFALFPMFPMFFFSAFSCLSFSIHSLVTLLNPHYRLKDDVKPVKGDSILFVYMTQNIMMSVRRLGNMYDDSNSSTASHSACSFSSATTHVCLVRMCLTFFSFSSVKSPSCLLSFLNQFQDLDNVTKGGVGTKGIDSNGWGRERNRIAS